MRKRRQVHHACTIAQNIRLHAQLQSLLSRRCTHRLESAFSAPCLAISCLQMLAVCGDVVLVLWSGDQSMIVRCGAPCAVSQDSPGVSGGAASCMVSTVVLAVVAEGSS